uniref:Chloride conductance regulatory protein ICln n=1 Tax=Kalanchoe fedtschenkoi TaxID=63787 RepID=A0A7N0U5K4_KALFE
MWRRPSGISRPSLIWVKLVRFLISTNNIAGTTAGQPILDADNGEEFMHVQSSVTVMLENRSPEAIGTLYITIKQVVWFSEVDGGIRRHTQIETGADEDDSEDSDWSNEPHDLSSITEMRHVPTDPNRLDNLFEIFCECAELNPEPIEDIEEQ